MGRRRRLAICLVLVALIALGAACSTDSTSASTKQARSAAQARAKAKRARAVAVQRRRLAARRLAAQRRAYAAGLRRRQARSATAIPTTVPVTVPTIVPATAAADLAAIQRTFTVLNAAFRRGVVAGIVTSNAANYWVASGVYSAGQCSRFEANRGEGVVSEAFAVHPETLKPTPGWVDPTVGKTPTGRIYSISVDNIQTLVPSGERRRQTVVTHTTVNPFGAARLFFRCK